MTWPPRNLTGYAKEIPHPHWPADSKICISFCLNYEEGGEYQTLLGSFVHLIVLAHALVSPNIDIPLSSCAGDAHSESYLSEISPRVPKQMRDPGIESEFDYGARAGIWRLLRLFEEMDMKCTVWGVGKALEGNGEVVREMVRGGHEVAGHGYR